MEIKQWGLNGRRMFFVLYLLQFIDSYSADLYSKIQSLYLRDLIIIPKGLTMEKATILLNEVAIPFFVISSLAPLLKILVDYIGKKKTLLINLIIMIIGCLVCGSTTNWLVFLFGNSIIAFACGADVYYLYIIDSVDEGKRATIRAIMASIAALSTMLIPIVRKWLVGEKNYEYRKMYFVAIVCIVIVGVLSIILLKDGAKDSRQVIRRKFERPSADIKTYIFILFCWGIGVSSVNFYNEPMAKIALKTENSVNTMLFIQPIFIIIVMLVSGKMADRFKRKKTVFADMILAICGILLYSLGTFYKFGNAYLLGLAWGIMVGGFFSATNLIFVIVSERAAKGNMGRVSAYATYANGIGNAIGMVLISILSNYTNLYFAKIIAFIPAVIAIFVLLKSKVSELL